MPGVWPAVAQKVSRYRDPKRIHDPTPKTIPAVETPLGSPSAEATKPSSAAVPRKITFRITPSRSIATERVIRPMWSVGSRRGRPIRRRTMRSRPSSIRMAKSRTWRPMSRSRPTPCAAIAARSSGASAIRSISFCASSEASRWSQT